MHPTTLILYLRTSRTTPGSPEMADSMPVLQKELSQISRKASLTPAVNDMDKMIAHLEAVREQVASGTWIAYSRLVQSTEKRLTLDAAQDPHSAGLAMTRLQNPIKEGFEQVNEDLKKVSKVQREFGKSLDKVRLPADTLRQPGS